MNRTAPTVILAVALVFVAAVGGFLFVRLRSTGPTPSPVPSPSPSATASTTPTNSPSTAPPTADPYADWSVYRDPTFGYELKTPPAWKTRRTATGLAFGTKLDQYNYQDASDGYGYVAASRQASDYGGDTPGLKVTETTVTIDGVSATKKVFEGSGFGSLTYPKTRLETYDFSRAGVSFHLEFTSAATNAELWSTFYLLTESWRFTP